MNDIVNLPGSIKSQDTILLDKYIMENLPALKMSIPSGVRLAVAEKMIRHSLQAMDENVVTKNDFSASTGSKGRKLSTGYMDAIGNTPLMPLRNIAEIHSLKCNLLAKCEFMNPSGSSKARTAAKIVRAVSQQSCDNRNQNFESPQTKPVLLHSRLGLAGTILARVNGFPSICLENQVKTQFYSNAFAVHGGFMINAKSETLQTLKDLMPSMIVAEKVKALCLSGNNSVISEIKEDLKRLNKSNPKIDMLVCTADFLLTDPKVTCELSKDTLLVVVGERPTFSCDFPIAHYYQINSNSKMFEGNQKLVKDGLFCSPKDGAVLHGALQSISRFNLKSTDANIILVLNESIRPHSQHNLDFLDFKPKKHFDAPTKENWWMEQVVGDIQVKSPGILDPDMQVQEAIRALRLLEHDQAVVQLSNPNVILGVTTLSHLESKLEQGTLQPGDTLGESGAIFKKFHVVKFSNRLKDLVRKLFKERFVCVVVQQVHECVQKNQDISDGAGQGQIPQICMLCVTTCKCLGKVSVGTTSDFSEDHRASAKLHINRFEESIFYLLLLGDGVNRGDPGCTRVGYQAKGH
ncbi:unnamed protein product [Allacma fusca]|uniref:Tryptophan synthase beta chain-like PALP domain-containing protein n=1 Tax=Allacma fusca TaxID=39272 RepID=A0A8J2KI64_9HEXA|nr:unnamed protein product [Allacma fusca]